MKVYFLGTSASTPSPSRGLPCIGVRLEKQSVLFDCGEGAQRQMMAAKFSYMRVNHIFITHLHCDHFLGVAGMLQTLSLMHRKTPIHIYGPEGTTDEIEKLLKIGVYGLRFDVISTDLSPGERVGIEQGRWVRTTGVDHDIPSLAYALEEAPRPGRVNLGRARLYGIEPGPILGRIQRGESVTLPNGRVVTPSMICEPPRPGRKIVVSGDTRPNKNIVKLAENGDVLIHEATFSKEHEETAKVSGHSTAEQAARIAAKSKVKALLLYHTSPRYARLDPLILEAREHFQNTWIPSDLSTVEITPNHTIHLHLDNTKIVL